MKSMAFVVGVVGLVFVAATLAQTQTESAEEELIKLENELNEAWTNRDIAPFDRILADDYMFTDEEGNVLTKAQELANIKSGAFLSTSCENDDVKARIYGDAAVVTGRSTYKGKFKGKPYTQQYRWTHMWVKDNLARWRCVASHASKIARRINVEADVAAIKASFDEWVRLSNAGDLDRIMSIFYTEDSIQMPPNASIGKGKDAILLGYRQYRELNDAHWDSCMVKDVRVSGDLAIAWGVDTGTEIPRSGGEAVKFDLKWLTALERQSDGTWKWIYEIWNDNQLLKTPENKQQD